MILNEFWQKEPDAYQDTAQDNSQPTLGDLRKTRLTLRQLNKLRKMNDVRAFEYKEKLKLVRQQYAPPPEAPADLSADPSPLREQAISPRPAPPNAAREASCLSARRRDVRWGARNDIGGFIEFDVQGANGTPIPQRAARRDDLVLGKPVCAPTKEKAWAYARASRNALA